MKLSTHSTFEFTTIDNTKIFAQKWLPDGLIKAKVILVHGLGEHSGRYAHVARFFNDQNIAMYSFDHRGHGKSSGNRGDIPSYKVACNDIEQIMAIANQELPAAPLFLYGHSLGGAIVLYFSLTKSIPLTGIICTSPGLATGAPLPPFKLFMAKTLDKILPKTLIANGLDVNNLSHDQKVIDTYIHDPLVHPKISARLGMELINKGNWMVDNAHNLNYPLLLLQGGQDTLVNPPMTAKFANNAPQNLITYHQFPHLYHEMHNEIDSKDFFDMIKFWIENQLQKVQSE